MKEVSEQLRKLRRQYLRYQQAEIIYSISHKKLFELASDAGAIYRIDGTVLINRDILMPIWNNSMNQRQERIRWCMGYARKDVEKTKKMAKKFVRYQEGAELYSIGLKFLSDSMKCPVFPVHFNHIFSCIFQIRSIVADSSKKKISLIDRKHALRKKFCMSWRQSGA